MSDKKPRGYTDKVLFIDTETSGIAMGCDDPTHNSATGETYQIVSIGLIVTNAETLNTIESLYIEIRWDGESAWSKEAEKIHGLTLAHLEENGMDEEEAVAEIVALLLKYWGPTGVVCLGGHNVATFDLPFFRALMRKYGFDVRFGSKTIDTNSVGFATFGTHNSDELFEMVGVPARTTHNALKDADAARMAVQFVRKAFAQCLDA